MFFGQPCHTSRISAVDARVKIAAGMAVLVLVLSHRGCVFPLYVLGAFCICCFGLTIPLRRVIVRFAEPLFIVFVLILLKFLFTGTDVLFSVTLFGTTITGHSDGLMEGFRIAERVLAAVSVIALLGFTTAFTDILSALAWFRVPREFVEILMLAYRYTFVIFEDAFVIYNAQKNRLGYSTVRRGLHSFGVLSGTLVLKAFDQSQTTTIAMLQRGYDGSIPRQKLPSFNRKEVAGALLVVVLLGVLWKL